MTGPRVVSLIASSTEIVCALGLRELLVGRSHECDHPAEIQGLPAVTAPSFPVTGSSREIDDAVRSRASNGLSLYAVDEALLRRLAPDVIVTQDQCEVCAVSLKEVEKTVCAGLGKDATVVALRPDDLAGVWSDIGKVAAALGASERGAALTAALRARMDAVAVKARGLAARPGVACLEWLDPLMAAANWVPELVGLAGGRPLFGESGKRSPALDWEAVRAADPDVVVAMPCGFSLGRTVAETAALERLPGWRDLRAVRAGRVFCVDANQYFTRPGPRLAESLEMLAHMLHPDDFPGTLAGVGWQRYP